MLRLELGQRLDIKQELRSALELRNELKLALQQELTSQFLEGPEAPKDVARDVLARTVEGMAPPIRASVEALLGGIPSLPEDMATHANILGVTNEGRLTGFSLSEMYMAADGSFFEEDAEDPRRRAPLRTIEKVYNNPAWAENEKKAMIEMMGQSVAGAALTDDYRDISKSLQIVESLRPTIEQMVLVLRHLLAAVDPQTGQKVQTFFREQSLIEGYMPFVSERIHARLVRSLSTIKETDQSSRYEHATLNAIGEMTLVGFGVIAPNLFERRELSSDSVETLDKRFADLGYSVEARHQLFDVRSREGVFWNRWRTLKQKPGPLTDIAVRDFITQHVRKDRAELLEACGYPRFFEGARGIILEAKGGNKDVRDLARIDLENHAAEMLGSSAVHDAIIRISAKSWHRDLRKLGFSEKAK